MVSTRECCYSAQSALYRQNWEPPFLKLQSVSICIYDRNTSCERRWKWLCYERILSALLLLIICFLFCASKINALYCCTFTAASSVWKVSDDKRRNRKQTTHLHQILFKLDFCSNYGNRYLIRISNLAIFVLCLCFMQLITWVYYHVLQLIIIEHFWTFYEW